MKTITMTEFNQRVSAVAREAIEQGEVVRITNRGRVVLRLVPEPDSADSPIEALFAAGLAAPPRREHPRIEHRAPVSVSRSVDELIEETNSDAGL
ncbi:MAG: type II toxin-antitoxin system Phd/YefM family antitoxin [Brevibacterium yomogidense]|uniref:Antitoxin n=1 Tax=Brevibacterium yomogidense TaxID=946573 RepID=A0A1X6X591_9MICO|nr:MULTISPECIES: type II toxin-antitoxin system Phd/YefM family antitoxin [Brevibacterium]SLM94374.1 hypothetical protein FM105_04095 [Brevibacterium yomogidense]SMX81090.1 Antitoxin Phd_YefM, type II toxin-antitoxin system [Brevibacterium sp. Mu109]